YGHTHQCSHALEVHALFLRRYTFDRYIHPVDGRAAPKNRSELAIEFLDRLPHPTISHLQFAAIQGVADSNEQTIQIGRLLEEVERAQLGGFDGRFDRAMARDHNDGDLGHLIPGDLEHLHPVALRHLDVQHDDVVVVGRHFLQGLVAVYGFLDGETLVLQDLPKCPSDARLINNENGRHTAGQDCCLAAARAIYASMLAANSESG